MGCGASSSNSDSAEAPAAASAGPPVARPPGAARFQYSYDAEAGTSNIDDYAKMTVVTPPGTDTGDPIPVKTPDGQTLEVPCPPGHETGMFSSFKNYTFTCYYLPKDAN